MVVAWFIIIATGVCVYADAKSIGMGKLKPGQTRGFLDSSPVGWGIGCVLLWIIIFPMYLIQRQNFVSQKSTASSSKLSDLSTLEKLADLKDRGLVTDEEFQLKKKEILGL